MECKCLTRLPQPRAKDIGFMHEPHVMRKLYMTTGLDPNYVQHEWHVMRQTEREELGVAQMVFLEVLQTLRGVKKPEMRDREVNLAEERIKSVEEFGTILPELLRNMCIWRCLILFISGSVESSICCDAALA